MHSLLSETQGPIQLAAIGTAVPDCCVEQSLALTLMKLHYGKQLTPRSMDVLEKMLSHPSIKTRHIAVDRPEELVSLKNEDPDLRIVEANEDILLYDQGHIPGAVNVPLDQLTDQIARHAPGKDQPLLLHCLSGGRSAVAQTRLKRMGYQHVFNLGSYGRAERIVTGGRSG